MNYQTETETETEIEHCHTVAPWYKSDNPTNQWDKYIRDWEDDVDQSKFGHGVEPSETNMTQYYPVVFDIETDAELPQTAELVTVYDTYMNHVTVMLDTIRTGYQIDKDQMKGWVADNFGDDVTCTIYSTVSRKKFEEKVLQYIGEKNAKLKEENIDKELQLVGHNIFFDLGILGKPNDEWLEVASSLSPNEWDGSMEYRNIVCSHKRAGAYGRIYQFDNKGGGRLYIPIVDTSTVSKSAWLPASLDGVAEHFEIECSEADEHGIINDEYIKYNFNDVKATYEVYKELEKYMHRSFGFLKPLSKVYSTASIAKAALERMDYDRVHYHQDAVQICAEAYAGGMTECLVPEGEMLEGVTMMDILSQYPTVCALTEVWDYMQVEEVGVTEIKPEQLPDYDKMETQEEWKNCANYYVQIKANDELLPIRGKMPDTETTRVYNAHTTHKNEATVHHYFDLIASELRANGEADIEIINAWKMTKSGEQDVRPTKVGGTQIEEGDNLMKRGIEERKEIQKKEGEKNERTKGLKITANSCYGISAERIVESIPKQITDDHRHDIAGKFYNPHVASTMTAGGRLQLAMGEAKANECGGEMYYCDTDSFVVDSEVAEDVQKTFTDLNPYDGYAGTLEVLQIEDGELHNGEEVDLHNVKMFGVSEKRYAMITQNQVVKYTEHGLGHYKQLRESEDNPNIVRKFWNTILHKHGHQVEGGTLSRDFLSKPVLWQQSVTTSNLRKLIREAINENVRYGDFMERSLTLASGGDAVNYVGINLRDDGGVRVSKSGKVDRVDSIEFESEAKRVGHIMNDWMLDIQTSNARPHMCVTGKKEVTKEASDIKSAWNEVLDEVLDKIDLGTLFG